MDASEEAAVEREARRVVVAALRLDAAMQDAGDFEAIAKQYDEVYAAVLSLCSVYPDTIATGFTFWDWWADARNHDWKYYDGIARDDWSRLARHVADSIEAGGRSAIRCSSDISNALPAPARLGG